jgi:hypothetical protein
MNFVPIEDHEAAHAAAATVLGVGVDSFEFDSWGLDGFHGRTHLSEEDLLRLGSFEGRKAMAVIVFVPRLALLDDPWGVNDDALIDDPCPTDYELRVWRWIVEQSALRVFATQEFAEAFAAARDRIEQQQAEA